MTGAQRRRLGVLAAIAGALGVAALLVTFALRDNLLYFYTPSQLQAVDVGRGRLVRLGGQVEPGSVQRERHSMKVRFVVADGTHRVPVVYEGLLPDLFKEGKGVVAQGKLGSDGVFVADQVLAKHDENYMPPEAADALKKAASAKPQATATLEPARDMRAAGGASPAVPR